MAKKKKKTVGSLFCGIGGIDLAFKNAGFALKWANEIDSKAVKTFSANFKHKIICEDMRKINPRDLKEVDILTAGFPCQPFSIAGNKKGFKDERGSLFFTLLDFLEVLKPKVFLFENVKNLRAHDKGKTFSTILSLLKEKGYFIHSAVLNTSEYTNIPQNRERVYIVGFIDQEAHQNFSFPKKIKEKKSIPDILDKKVDKSFYYEGKACYPSLEKAMTSHTTCYQWRRKYVRENKSNMCPTLTANMGTGGHNVPLVLDDNGIRKITPRECARFQGFPDEFILPRNIGNSSLYKQFGNSVSIPVVEAIAKKIHKSLCT